MTDLKPCPFCGGQVTIANYGDYLSIISKGTDPRNSCRCRLFMESEQFEEGDKEDRRRAEDSLSEKWNRRFDGWQTGTPTEGGLFLVYTKDGYYDVYEFNDGYEAWDIGFRDVVAWQKIDPYKEESNEHNQIQ